MTAVVGILNKQAVAIAADSAVTIGGKTILNKSNKVFTLSKYHPVGVMLYNSASFMSTPWETIIKIYRNQLGKNHFPTVKDYQDDFLNYLQTKNYFSTEKSQKQHLFGFSCRIVKSIISDIVNVNKHLIDTPTDASKAELLQLLEAKVDEYIAQISQNLDLCEGFIDYTIEDFTAFSNEPFDELIKVLFTENALVISNELKDKLIQILYLYLKAKEVFTNFTGLIFAGFGEDEKYPQLISVNVSLVVDNRLRCFQNIHNQGIISNDNESAICPFAQVDVINTILTGIDPELDTIHNTNFEALFTKFTQEILNIIGNGNPILSAQIQGLDIKALVNEYAQKNQEAKINNYIAPLMRAVMSLSKDDLAEMAESLIYLTYLKRRITFAEESVGGPVDVAIISKGDGFIWIKRKHYFKPELNNHFFQNYFNKE